jgi:hypothetical protein
LLKKALLCKAFFNYLYGRFDTCDRFEEIACWCDRHLLIGIKPIPLGDIAVLK